MTNDQARLISYAIITGAGTIGASMGNGGAFVGLIVMICGLICFATTRLK